MKGDIYTNQKCPACGSKMTHNEKRNNCFCVKCSMPASKGYFIRFENICKRFSSSYPAAAQFLNGLRFKSTEGTYDRRDYQKEQPLGFENQAEAWLAVKKTRIKKESFKNLRNYINKAVAVWGNRNIKTIGFAAIEDFLFNPNTTGNDKTRSNIKSCLHDFFKWISNREGIPVPDMPQCSFELGWRNYTDWETQTKIIDKIKEQTFDSNPKIWFGVELLAGYAELRPDDLRRITEADFDAEAGLIIIRNPTKKKNKLKIIKLLPEHVEIYKELTEKYPGLPNLPFFRHIGGISGTASNQSFGQKYFYKKWVDACKSLGITGLDLYGGTRHTTTTELAKVAGRDNAKKFTGHDTNRAFERYCQAQDSTAFQMAKVVADKKRKPAEVIELTKKS